MRRAPFHAVLVGVLLAAVAHAEPALTRAVDRPDPLMSAPAAGTAPDSEVARIVLGSRVSNDPRDHEMGITMWNFSAQAPRWLGSSGLAYPIDAPEDLTEPLAPPAAPQPDYDL